MTKTEVLLVTLVIYNLLLIVIGVWAQSRTRDEEDFFLGGRKLGALVAAISYSSSASSAWTLLGVSGMAFVIGLPVIWIAGGSISGMLIAWFWIAPRISAYTRQHGHITLTDLLAQGSDGTPRRRITITASLIILLSFTFYVAAQFQATGNLFSSSFDFSMTGSILIGAGIILVYTLLGGFWAVSVTDTVQGLLMAATALLLPLAALDAAGGWTGFIEGLRAVSSPAQLSWTGTNAALYGAGVIVGSLAIGLGTYGQPHLLVRFMALRDERALRFGRMITIAWYLLVFSGMCLLGLLGHVLVRQVDNPENIFFVLANDLFNPVIAGLLLAGVLSAIMSTADSQLLVSASAVARDLRGSGAESRPRNSLLVSRLAIALVVVLSVLVALYMPEKIFSRVLFAWSALGAAFGPVVILRLAGVALRPSGVLASMLTGFGFSIVFYLLPNAPGDVAERMVPFVLSTIAAWTMRQTPEIQGKKEGAP